jgi:hypothetical protein
MPNKNNYWTTQHGGQWVVKREGSERATSVHPSQEEAWGEARRLARGAGGEALLHGRDGKIRARNSYETDPFPPKG